MTLLPTPQRPVETLDLEWAARELIPFLELVFGKRSGHATRPTSHWVRMVLFATLKLDKIPFYEDFPSTIERLRLCLVNPGVLTAAELAKFSRVVAQGEQLCIRIFVRHAMRHGSYELYSLGANASLAFPRRPEEEDKMDGAVGRPCGEFAAPPQYEAVMAELQKQWVGAGKREEYFSKRIAAERQKGDFGYSGGDGSDTFGEAPQATSSSYNGPLCRATGNNTSSETLCLPLSPPPTSWPSPQPSSPNSESLYSYAACPASYHLPVSHLSAPLQTRPLSYYHTPYMDPQSHVPPHIPSPMAAQPASDKPQNVGIRPDAPEFVPGATFARRGM